MATLTNLELLFLCEHSAALSSDVLFFLDGANSLLEKSGVSSGFPRSQYCEHEGVGMQETSACCIRVLGCMQVTP